MISTKREGDSPIVAEAMAIMDGEAMLQEVIQEPTLDIYLDRAPKLGTPINYPEMVGVLRRKREAFITAEQKRKSGIKDEE